MSTSEQITATDPVWRVEPGQVPRATVASGAHLRVATLDCRGGAITTMEDRWQVDEPDRINPVTGPIGVTGASPGDTLVVAVEQIDLADQGLMLVRPGTTAFDFVDHGELTFAEIGDETYELLGHELPLRPMVGWVGTQPARDVLETGACGPTGGNLDTPLLGVGARVLLPVQVDGACLYLGDVHASQGDGELFLTGVETPATVGLSVETASELGVAGPVVETADVLAVIGPDTGLDASATGACERAIAILGTLAGVPPYDAGFLLSAACDLRVSRFLPGYGSVCRLEIPKHLLSSDVLDGEGWLRTDLGPLEPGA